MAIRVRGTVSDLETGEGIPDVTVRVLDKDLLFDDVLGECRTRADGAYRVEFSEESSRDLFADRPDIYLMVESAAGRNLASTADEIRSDVEEDLVVDVGVTHAALVRAGLAEPLPADWMRDLDPETARAFKTWTWRDDADADDEAAAGLRAELSARTTVLEFMGAVMDDLEGSVDNDAPPFRKLARLFELGRTPERMDGHFFGVSVGIRTGDLEGLAAGFGNVLGFLYGTVMADICPWVGKSMTPMSATKRDDRTASALDPETRTFAGINHFNRIDLRPLNEISFRFLSWWMGQTDAPEAERRIFGHEKNGGEFMAYRGTSVYEGSPREVWQLNYRWPRLGNPPPFRWLIDELVEVAEGLYLGQLLFATRRLLRDFDPERPREDDGYEHFGYFLLFDDRWNPEARRLFPHLEMSVLAPGLGPAIGEPGDPEKFARLTFADPLPETVDDTVLTAIRQDMRNRPTIMHLLKHYSEEIQEDLHHDSPAYRRVRELFLRGVGIETVEGHFRGALVSWHSEALTGCLDFNLLNLAWMRVGASFSTWTGKTFERISPAKLDAYTDGRETGELPTFWGSNTQALRTPRERFVGKLMKLAGVKSEEVPADEARVCGYDLKNFFFIARQARSVDPGCAGKTIFQFNYRWPKLETMPPDCFCVDELVQIADGLYLGQLMYATELLKPYDPDVDTAEYRYRHFGFFLLMDDEWHRIRLDIGFDLENV